MNQPMAGRTQIVGHDEARNRTIDQDGGHKNARSKRNPGVTKQFLEPADEGTGGTDRGGESNQDLKNIKKNNFL